MTSVDCDCFSRINGTHDTLADAHSSTGVEGSSGAITRISERLAMSHTRSASAGADFAPQSPSKGGLVRSSASLSLRQANGGPAQPPVASTSRAGQQSSLPRSTSAGSASYVFVDPPSPTAGPSKQPILRRIPRSGLSSEDAGGDEGSEMDRWGPAQETETLHTFKLATGKRMINQCVQNASSD